MPGPAHHPTHRSDAQIVDEARRDPVLGPRVAAAVAELPPAYRDALTMHLWQELSLHELAAATRVSPAIAGRRVGRALAYVSGTLTSARGLR